jgi:CMP-N,N'-diacetyllegionaminic acid synthase
MNAATRRGKRRVEGDVLCVVPARGGSKGVKMKNLIPVHGPDGVSRPLMQYPVMAARKCGSTTRTVVSTENARIKRVARDMDVEVVNRPAEMARDESALEDCVRHAVRTLYGDAPHLWPEITVILMANVILRRDGVIDECVDKLLEEEREAVVTVRLVSERPEWMKVLDGQGRLQPREKCRIFRRQELPEVYILDGAVMAVMTRVLMSPSRPDRIHSYLGDDIGAVVLERDWAHEIDEPFDVAVAEAIMSGRGEVNRNCQQREV